MRTIGKRSFVLYILLAAFIFGCAWFIISLFSNASEWASQPYNRHISLSAMGDITDRNGNVLAESQEGSRSYNDNPDVRRAFLHTVGDDNGSIATSVQATMHSKLSGYNFITGWAKTPISLATSGDVKLTVDMQTTMAAYNALGDKKGAAIMYNYKTGEILAKVSKPTFDPENTPEDILDNEAYEGVYIDRAISSSFTPGSIFKVVTLAASMDKFPSDWQSKTYVCEGSVNIGGSEVTCMGNHGEVNAHQALGHSCNVYFASLAAEMGADALQDKAESFGFNKHLDFSGIKNAKSTVNLKGADANQVAWAGIGQYTDLANPYHILTLMGAIANEGTYVQPKISNSTSLFGGNGSGKYMNAQQANELKNAMRIVVSDYYGDSFFPENMQVCAKTGTAEVGEDKGNNCWIAGFSSNPDTPYAFVVVVEDSSSALQTAGSIASEMLSAAKNIS